jgi:hypothetical protein
MIRSASERGRGHTSAPVEAPATQISPATKSVPSRQASEPSQPGGHGPAQAAASSSDSSKSSGGFFKKLSRSLRLNKKKEDTVTAHQDDAAPASVSADSSPAKAPVKKSSFKKIFSSLRGKTSAPHDLVSDKVSSQTASPATAKKSDFFKSKKVCHAPADAVFPDGARRGSICGSRGMGKTKSASQPLRFAIFWMWRRRPSGSTPSTR